MIHINITLKEDRQQPDGTWTTEIKGKPYTSTQRNVTFICERFVEVTKAFNITHVDQFQIIGREE
jgi:hypothetical protein